MKPGLMSTPSLFPGLLGEVRCRLDADGFEAGNAGLVKEVAGRRADLEESAGAPERRTRAP